MFDVGHIGLLHWKQADLWQNVQSQGNVYCYTSYWYYNLILLPKLPDDFATDVLQDVDDWLINSWSVTDQVSMDAAVMLLSD